MFSGAWVNCEEDVEALFIRWNSGGQILWLKSLAKESFGAGRVSAQ
jgi:hypothetical protein